MMHVSNDVHERGQFYFDTISMDAEAQMSRPLTRSLPPYVQATFVCVRVCR
jgi:hypothetical protein